MSMQQPLKRMVKLNICFFFFITATFGGRGSWGNHSYFQCIQLVGKWDQYLRFCQSLKKPTTANFATFGVIRSCRKQNHAFKQTWAVVGAAFSSLDILTRTACTSVIRRRTCTRSTSCLRSNTTSSRARSPGLPLRPTAVYCTQIEINSLWQLQWNPALRPPRL